MLGASGSSGASSQGQWSLILPTPWHIAARASSSSNFKNLETIVIKNA
jgi:hypothetical protein